MNSSSTPTGCFPQTRRRATSPAASTNASRSCRSSRRTVTSRRAAARRRAVRGSGRAVHHARPLRDAAAARGGRRPRRPRASATALAADPRHVWRTFCEHWHLFAGTASGYWLTPRAASTLFGIRTSRRRRPPTSLFDARSHGWLEPAYRPRALFERFGIEVLATTDDPMDDLVGARRPRRRSGVPRPCAADLPSGRVPRPRRRRDSSANVERLTGAPGTAIDDFAGYLEALEERRAHFIEHGAVSADHGVREAAHRRPRSPTRPPRSTAARSRATLDAGQARVFTGHMLFQMARHERARRARDDHPPRRRTAITPPRRFERFGPDTGHDIPITTSTPNNLRPLLERYGLEPGLPPRPLRASTRPSYSREIAPLAGLLSERLHRSALVVPRRPRRGAAVPLGRHRDRRASTAVPASSTTPARSSPSRLGTTWRGGSTPPSWRGSCARVG